MSERFLKEAIRIGDQLLGAAEHDEHGIFWQSMGIGSNQEVAWRATESIYSGCSGISLFLLELYKQTGNESYLTAAKDAMTWTDWYCSVNPTNNYALLTGRMGVSYAHLQLYKATKEATHLKKALAITRSCGSFLNQPKEYINGTSGVLLGLLHLHAASKEPWLLELIKDYTQSLLESAQLGNGGLYWDSSTDQIRPLCGFSHGTSGIGFVFLELGHYFKNPAFYEVADQTFAYENAYYDTKMANWPDFRLHMWRHDQVVELERAYEAGDLKPFTKTEGMNAWCHGAAGIGLARMHAYTLSGNKKYLKDTRRALDKTKLTIGHLNNFSLCHGEGGNAEDFIESYALFHDKEDLRHAERIGDAAIHQRAQLKRYVSGMEMTYTGKGEDTSLFNGIAGVGYFLLRLHDQKKTPSILAPKLSHVSSAKKLPLFSITPPELRKRLIKNTFPRSLARLPDLREMESYFERSTEGDPLKKSFIQYIKSVQSVLPEGQRRELTDVFSIEQLKSDLVDQRPSSGLLYIKGRLNQKEAGRILQLPDTEFIDCRVRLAEECRIVEFEKDKPILLKLTSTGIDEQHISLFCRTILRAFTDAKDISHAIEEVVQFYDVQKRPERKMVQEKIITQIKEALIHNVLIAS